jgi:hypothetical protein
MAEAEAAERIGKMSCAHAARGEHARSHRA